MTDCVALVVAAGRGMRAGGGMPKQYRALAGSSVLRFSLDAFATHPRVGAVRAVIHPDDRTLYDAAASGLDLLAPVAGGSTRQESVRLGLESLAALAPRHVLIHDGARPFVDAGIIDRTLDALAQAPAAIAAVPLADTLKRGIDGRVRRHASIAPGCGARKHRRDSTSTRFWRHIARPRVPNSPTMRRWRSAQAWMWRW